MGTRSFSLQQTFWRKGVPDECDTNNSSLDFTIFWMEEIIENPKCAILLFSAKISACWFLTPFFICENKVSLKSLETLVILGKERGCNGGKKCCHFLTECSSGISSISFTTIYSRFVKYNVLISPSFILAISIFFSWSWIIVTVNLSNVFHGSIFFSIFERTQAI